MSLEDIYIKCPECAKSRLVEDAVCSRCHEDLKDEKKKLEDKVDDFTEEIESAGNEIEDWINKYNEVLAILKACPHCSTKLALDKLEPTK
jgi:DNA-directed RNA polymerase subunit RPC12/RpoP